MDTNNAQDPANQAGQVQQTPADQQTSQQVQQTPADATNALSPEQIATLQAQAAKAAELEQKFQQLESNYGELRKDYTKKSQALAQLVTGEPQQAKADPLAAHVQRLVARGYSAEDARAVAETAYEMMQPLQQQTQQLFQSQQAVSAVGDVLRQSWGERPDLFTDPEVNAMVEQQLRWNAMNGHPCDAQAARFAALDFKDRIDRERTANPNRRPAIPVQPPFASFSGPAGGFQPAGQPKNQQPQLSPHAQSLDAQMASYLQLPKQA